MGSIHYMVKSLVILATDEDLEIPIFGKIEAILQNSSTNYVVCKLFTTWRFDEHLHAYVLKETNKFHSFHFQNQPIDFQMLDLYKVQGELMTTLKYKTIPSEE